jgi:broad specificity phosphatase PhoE
MVSNLNIGETEWTISGRYTGRSDIPLTVNGEKQVSASADVVVGPGKIIDPSKIAHLFISPRTRAKRTFEILFDGPAQKQLEGKSEISEDIREWEYGLYEGKLAAQIRAARKERGLDKERSWVRYISPFRHIYYHWSSSVALSKTLALS